jgi:hypothetical protein
MIAIKVEALSAGAESREQRRVQVNMRLIVRVASRDLGWSGRPSQPSLGPGPRKLSSCASLLRASHGSKLGFSYASKPLSHI